MAVEFTNINSILSFYDKNDESNYKVYRGTKCQHVADQYLKGNKEEGAEQLEKFLENLNNANEYVLQMISVKNSKELAPSCIFKLEKKEERQQVGNFYNNNAEVLSRLASIENNLNNINTNEEQDYTEEQPKNFLGQILENESVKEMLITSIGALLTNLLQPKFQTSTVLAGIDESEETAQTAEESLKILFQKGLTVNDLFLLSKKTKTELNYLLKMLRS